MRTVNLLVAIGFTNLQPLRSNKSRRESDLLGVFNQTMFAIEVFRSNEVASRFPNHNLPTQNLQNYIATRYKEKRSQLDASMNAHKCSKALLAVVMDSQPANALVSGDEWRVVAAEAFEMMGSPDNTHLLVFTGMADINGQDEQILYPPLEKRSGEGVSALMNSRCQISSLSTKR